VNGYGIFDVGERVFMTVRGIVFLQDSSERVWERGFLFFICTLMICRVLFLYFSNLELSPDEAYYWEWSRRLDWGYYSKPPMVAWIMALSTWLMGNSAFAVRLPAVILSTFALLGSYLAGRAMFSARAGFCAALLAAASPGACVAALVMTIDAPLLFFWSFSLFCVWKAVQAEVTCSNCPTVSFWWILTGVMVGAGFLTKQTMFAFWPAVLMFLITGRDTRRLLKSCWIWVSVSVSAVLLAPVVWWNMHHGWITIRHTAHHFEQIDRNLFDSLRTLAEFVGSQLGVISPITCFLAFAVGIGVLVRFRDFILRSRADDPGSLRLRRAAALLVFSGTVLLLLVTLLSLKQRVNANWPAPFYIAPMILVAAWYCGHISIPGIDRLRKLVMPGVVIGAVMSMLLYLLPVVIPASGLQGSAVDPLVRLRGWKMLATRIDMVKDSLPMPEKTFVIARRRQTASELAFYMPGNPVVYRWKGHRGRVTSQYELWPGPEDKAGWDAVIVIDADKAVPDDLPSHFRDFKSLSSVSIPLGNRRYRRFNIFLGRGFDPRVSHDDHVGNN